MGNITMEKKGKNDVRKSRLKTKIKNGNKDQILKDKERSNKIRTTTMIIRKTIIERMICRVRIR